MYGNVLVMPAKSNSYRRLPGADRRLSDRPAQWQPWTVHSRRTSGLLPPTPAAVWNPCRRTSGKSSPYCAATCLC